MITWFSLKSKDGTASLNKNCISLNSSASKPFEYAYRVKVGVDSNKNIVIESLSRDKCENGIYDESSLLKPQSAKTIARISSRDLMKALSDMTGIDFGDEVLKYPTSWNEKDSQLIIRCGGDQ